MPKAKAEAGAAVPKVGYRSVTPFTYVNAEGVPTAHGAGMTLDPAWPYDQTASPGVSGSPRSEIDEVPRLTEQTLALWRAFADLPVERRRWALTRGGVETGQAGEVLTSRGDVVVIVAGALATGVAGSGLTAEILGPGDVVATGSERDVSGTWIVGGQVYRTSMADWIETAGPEGLSYLLGASDRRRERLERGLHCAAYHLATERLADILTALQAVTGTGTAPLSQERLGVMLGLRRTTVNASCRALQAEKLTRTIRGQIRLMDVEGLRRVSCGCRSAHLTSSVVVS